jgi:hypothetical protein
MPFRFHLLNQSHYALSYFNVREAISASLKRKLAFVKEGELNHGEATRTKAAR